MTGRRIAVCVILACALAAADAASARAVGDVNAPSVTLGGSLAAASPTVELPAGGTELRVSAKDPVSFTPGDSLTYESGVKSIEILVDGVRRYYDEQDCPGSNCTMDRSWAFITDAYTPGTHTIHVTVTDEAGNATSPPDRTVLVGSGLSLNARGVGIEDFFAYRSIDTGAGSQAMVNVANGNLVWHHRPVFNAGRGLDTTVDLTYNSLGGLSDLGHLGAPIGDGFSLAIASLTRVNEPLEIHHGGTITLTDADGTMHRFTKHAGAAYFDPPAGVNLRLRRYYDSPTTTAQRNKTWAATRPDGTTYFFDACGYQRSVEDRNGNALTFVYDEARMPSAPVCLINPLFPARLLSVTDAGGRALTIAYRTGFPDRIASITDHAGRRLEFTYSPDLFARLTRIEDASGTAVARHFDFGYETSGFERDVNRITDPLGHATTIDYDDDFRSSAAGFFGLGERVRTLTDRRAKTSSFTYLDPPGSGQQAEVVDRNTFTWLYTTDGQLRPTQVKDPQGTITEYGWDADDNVEHQTRALGIADEATTTLTWNANGMPLTARDPLGHTTKYTYRDSRGIHLAQSGVDASGTFVSDLRTVTTPRNGVTTYDYDTALNGNVRRRTDEEGFRTEWDYDGAGQVITERRETDRTVFAATTYGSYDANGLPGLVTDARGNATATAGDGQWRYLYDAAGNVTDAQDPRASTAPSAGTNAEPFTTEYAYDALDRLKLERTPLRSDVTPVRERVRNWEYDGNDNLQAYVDGTGARFERDYDDMDDVVLSRTPATPHDDDAGSAPEETRYSYSGEQQVSQVEAPKGRVTTRASDYTTGYSYDSAGRRTRETRRSRNPEPNDDRDLVTVFSYDKRDNLTGVVDPNGNLTRKRWDYTYDRADNLIKSVENPTAASGAPAVPTYRCYDADDNLVAVTDARGTQPDCANLAASAPYTARYAYDRRDLLTSSEIPRDPADASTRHRVTSYVLRGDGQPSSVTTPRGNSSAVAGDLTTSLTYDPMGAVLTRSIPWVDNQYRSMNGTRGDDPKTWKVSYTRDEIGDPKTITDARGNAFGNTFFDTGELRTTARPGFWIYDADQDGVRERTDDDPESGGGGTPGGEPAGDFGTVSRQSLPGMLPLAGDVTLDYDDEMRLTSAQPGTNNPRRIARDALGRETGRTYPFKSGHPITTARGYDLDGNLSSTTDGRGETTSMAHDQFDRLVSVSAPGAGSQTDGTTGAVGRSTTYAYDANGNVTLITDPRERLWRSAYDPLDRLRTSTDPSAGVTSTDYDVVGNRTRVLPPRGQGASDPDQYATFYGYDAANELTSLEEGRHLADSRLTTFAYDDDGNQTRMVEPGSARAPGGQPAARITERTFDGRGLPWTVTTGVRSDRNGQRTTVTEFDANGNLRRRVNPAGVDRAARVPRQADPGTTPLTTSTWYAHSTLSTFDSDNLLASIFMPFAKTSDGDTDGRWREQILRDGRGRVSRVYSPRRLGAAEERSTGYTYFDTDWIRTADDSAPGTAPIVYDYDDAGDQTGWHGEAGSTQRDVTREFWPSGDLRERRATKTEGSAVSADRTYRYGYDDGGLMTAMLDVRPMGEASRRTTYSYDDLGRQTRANETWEGGGPIPSPRDTKVEYDPDSNPSVRWTDGQLGADGVYSGGKKTTFTYDTQERESRMVVTQGNAPTRTIDTSYYPSGDIALRERSRSDTDRHVLDRRYFAEDGRVLEHTRHRLDTGTTGATQVQLEDQTYGYDDASNESPDDWRWGNGDRSKDERGTYDFNGRDQLIRWSRKKDGDGHPSDVTYSLNGDGAITQKVDRRTLTNGTVKTDTTDYCYLPAGVPCFAGQGSGTSDQLRAAQRNNDPSTKTTYDYDAFGVMKSASIGSSTTTYVHDVFERLTSTRAPGATSDTATYRYDGLDRREQRSSGGTVTDLSYVGSTPMLSREGPSNKARFYDYDSALRRTGQATTQTASQIFYRSYATDANGSVTGLEDAQAAFSSSAAYSYDPYGNLTDTDGENEVTPPADTAGAKNPFRFQGFYADDPSGSYDMQARDYQPGIARFLSADRFESSDLDQALDIDPSTNNRYVFAAGDPVDRIEFDGHAAAGSGSNNHDPDTDISGATTPAQRAKHKRNPPAKSYQTPAESQESLRPGDSVVQQSHYADPTQSKRPVWKYPTCPPTGCITPSDDRAGRMILGWAFRQALGDDPAEVAFNLTAGKFVKGARLAFGGAKLAVKGGVKAGEAGYKLSKTALRTVRGEREAARATDDIPPYARSQYGRMSKTEREGALKKAPTCPYCGEAESTQADHVTSLKHDWESGGYANDRATRTDRANDSDNLIGACEACNKAKGAKAIGREPGQWWPNAWGDEWWPFGGP